MKHPPEISDAEWQVMEAIWREYNNIIGPLICVFM